MSRSTLLSNFKIKCNQIYKEASAARPRMHDDIVLLLLKYWLQKSTRDLACAGVQGLL